MAAIAIAAYLENGGLSYTADILRRATKALRLTQGVAAAGDMAVSQNGTPNMSVNVAAGQAVVDGTQLAATQGAYVGTNDATANLTVAASDPTNPRIDIVVAQFEDSVYSGAANDFKLAVVTGTPAGSPVAPATPANAIVLAQVRVNAGVTSITNSNITDLRTFVTQAVFPGVTGFTVWDSTATFRNLQIADGGTLQTRGPINIPPSISGAIAATSYGTVPVKIGEVVTAATAASVSFTSIPAGFRDLIEKYTARSNSAGTSLDFLNMQLNGVATATYYYEDLDVHGTTTTAPNEALAQTAAAVGVVVQGGAEANAVSRGVINIPSYGDAFLKGWTYECEARYNTTTGTVGMRRGAGTWDGTAAVTQTTIIPGASTFVSGLVFTLQGVP